MRKPKIHLCHNKSAVFLSPQENRHCRRGFPAFGGICLRHDQPRAHSAGKMPPDALRACTDVPVWAAGPYGRPTAINRLGIASSPTGPRNHVVVHVRVGISPRSSYGQGCTDVPVWATPVRADHPHSRLWRAGPDRPPAGLAACPSPRGRGNRSPSRLGGVKDACPARLLPF